jgi:hypothetical protein
MTRHICLTEADGGIMTPKSAYAFMTAKQAAQFLVRLGGIVRSERKVEAANAAGSLAGRFSGA